MPENFTPTGEFPDQGFDITGHLIFDSGVCVEIAIRALRLTERHVKVQTDALVKGRWFVLNS